MKKIILFVLVALFVIYGLVDGVMEVRKSPASAWAVYPFGFIQLVLIVCWYHLDSTEKKFKRPAILTMGVIGLTKVGIPVYIYLSNPRGRRLRAIARLLGYCCLLALAAAIGEAIGNAIW